MGARSTASAPLRGVLRQLDTSTGRTDDLLWVDPPADEHPGAGEHAELTGSELSAHELIQCTRTSVLALAWPGLVVQERVTHPLFTDVHHAVRLADGALAVAVTGHDSVLVLHRGRVTAWTWLGHPDGRTRTGDEKTPPEGFAAAYPGVSDFRRVPFDRYKPHRVHPNHLALLDGALWVTGLQDRSFRPLVGAEGARFDSPPHDGRRLDGALWFTTVDGSVTALDPATRAAVRTLSADAGLPGLPGWCRAVEKVGDTLFVGWSMLRASRHRELLRVALRGAAGTKRPTRVTELDLTTGAVRAEHPVGDHGGGTIYAIHAIRE